MVIVAVHCDAVREAAVFEKRLAAVSPERRQKVMAQKSPEDKRRSLCAALALDACLRTVGLRECEQTYITEPHGRPSLAAHPEWYFSLSHSGEYAVCALSNAPVGVDVEKYRPIRAEALAKRYFSADEAETLAALSGKEQERYFFARWTAKESVLKARGVGLGGGLSDAVAKPPFALWEYALPDHAVCVCGCEEFPKEMLIFSYDSDLPR